MQLPILIRYACGRVWREALAGARARDESESPRVRLVSLAVTVPAKLAGWQAGYQRGAGSQWRSQASMEIVSSLPYRFQDQPAGHGRPGARGPGWARRLSQNAT